MNKNANIIFIILTAIVVAGGAYWYFFTDTGNDPALTASSSSGNKAQAHFQTLVSQLKPIVFDQTILSDPKFLSLQDLTTSIVEESIGRPDPFAPVAGMSAR